MTRVGTVPLRLWESGDETEGRQPFTRLVYASGAFYDEEFGSILDGQTLDETLERNGFDTTSARQLFPRQANGVSYVAYQRRDVRPREFLMVELLDGDVVTLLPDAFLIRGIEQYSTFVRDRELVLVAPDSWRARLARWIKRTLPTVDS